MKFLKKAISLVLVLAMLASFAGMTGFTPSIIAEAAFTTEHGAVVRMPLTVYSRYYSSAGVLSSYSSVAGDYLITSEANTAHGVDLEWYVAPPSGTTGFDVHMRINDTDAWTPLWSGSSGLSINAYPTITRDAGTAQNLDYGKLYGNCGVRGNGGFKDVDTVYVRLMLVSASGTTYDYWEVKVINEDKMVEVDMWDTIYKINHSYTMSFPKAGEYATKLNSDDGDYAIPHFDEANNLAYTITFPTGTTGNFSARCSLDNSNWQAGYNTAVPSDLSWERGATTAMQDEYGVLYRDLLWGKGVKGFRDYGRIYWKVEYTCNGNTYTKYWYVNLVDWDKKDSQGVSKQWNGAASSSKPTDSLAAQNTLSNVHVPATLYLSDGSVLQSVSSTQGTSRRLDTYVMFDVPTGAYDVGVYQVDIDDNVISGQLTFTKLGNFGNTYKWNISGTASAGNVYYRIQYKVDAKDVTGNVRTVTYIQYAASYAKNRPNYNAVWLGCWHRDKSGNGLFKSTFFHEWGFSSVFAINGADLSLEKLNFSSLSVETNVDGSWDLWGKASGSNALGARFSQASDSSDEDHKWTAGKSHGTGNTSTATLGAKIYFDPQAKTVNTDSGVSAGAITSASIYVDSYFGNRKDEVDAYYDAWWRTNWALFDGYGEHWYSASSVTYSASYDRSAVTQSSQITKYTYSGKNLYAGTDTDGGSDDTAYGIYTIGIGSKNLRCVSQYTGMSYAKDSYEVRVAYGWHIDMVSVDRSSPHDVINTAIASNYVKEEMDSTWWNNYRKSIFAAYVNCGNLTATEQTSYDADLSHPVYRFADYADLNTAILTAAPWDRGGKTSDGSSPDANYIDWGANYEKWNAKTYATDYGKVSGSLAAYDLVFEENTDGTMNFYVSDAPRTGSYYYTAATWNDYTAARDYAAKIYNYPNSTVAKFDYDTAYPAKAATDNGNQANIGLACYCQSEIDAAASRLNTKREALVTYDVKNGNYDIEQYYRKLLSQLGSIAYDNSAKQLFDINTKHGFAGITSEIYDEATILFRASNPDDVFDYIWTTDEVNDPGYLGDGWVKVDENGNPLAIDDKGTPDDTSDDEVVLASKVGDVGILAFPRGNEALRPVGKGNTFSQLYFDNSAASQYAVTSARAALRNRLRWRMGGGGAAGYEYLGMVEGVYNQEGLTEDNLNDNPTKYFWTGKEHQDDILREVYALYRVKITLRLAANYRDVVDALNATSGVISVPDYDAEGTKYNEKELHNVTLFQSYTGAWDTVSFTVNNKTYNTTGKTWYTEDTWAGFVNDRNILAKMIYNGSTGTNGSESEIGKDYVYESGLANKYYTYDVKLSSGLEVTNIYYTNGYYQAGGNLAADYQDDINTAVANYKAWFNGDESDGKELVLKNLDAYTWKAYDETTVSSIEQKVASLYKEIDTTQEFVDFVPTETDGKLTGAALNPTTIKLYDQADINELNLLADAVTALHESTTAEAVYKGSDNLGDKVVAFDSALAAFNEKYKEIKDGEYYVDKSSWSDIFTHLTTLAGGTPITTENILSKLTTLYNDTNLDANNQGDVYKAIEAAITAYTSATTQKEVNDAVTALYNALSTPLTSVEVGKAADAAIAYPKNLTFNVYNYTMESQSGSHATPSRFTADSVNELTTAATAAKTHEYNMLGTYTSSLTAKATEVTALQNLKSDNNGGVLEYNGAVTTYLEQAIAYAEGQLYSDVDNQVVKTTRVTNPAGDKYEDVPLYSEQSVAELKVTLAEAKEALAMAESGKYGWADQIELDKYTFLVYDETAPDTGDNAAAYLLAKGIVSDAAYGLPYKWGTVAEDGTVTKEDLWESAANGYYVEGLYGNRLKAQTGMANAGLQSGPAYYGFLDAEYKATTVVKTNDDGTTTTTDYKTIVWDGEGNLILTSNNVAVGATTFNNWSSYIEYYDQVATLSKDLTIDDQSTIDTLAANIYRTRNALTLNYFPSNQEGFAEATKLFNQLKAYETATTPITRYGYAADAEGNVTYDEDGALIKGEPTDSAKQLVAIYSDIPAAFVTAVAEFEAKYANMNSTEPYNSWEDGKVMDLYNTIYNTYLNPETAGDNLITAKPANHDDFKAGMNDLVENYIAGEWENDTTYITDLLNDTQKNQLQTLLTAAQGEFSADKTVDTLFGGAVANRTNDIFTYVQTPATDLQFAVHMRDHELFKFLDLTVEGSVPFYYGGDGKYEIRVFRDIAVETVEENANSLFEKLDAGTYDPGDGTQIGWPAIYEINGIKWNKSAAEAGSEAVSITGYTGDPSTHKYTGENTLPAIVAILEQVGSYSQNYVYAAGNANSFNIEPYEWLDKNAVTAKGSDSVILGDYKKTGVDYPAAYETPAWYNGDEYATVVDSDGGYYSEDWFTDLSGVSLYKNRDDIFDGEATLNDYLSQAEFDLHFIYVYTEFGYESYIQLLQERGWSPIHASGIVEYAKETQIIFDSFANEWYQAICDLQLLPATEAYREVMQAYYGLKGLKVNNWNGDTSFEVAMNGNAEDTSSLEYYTFYNLTDGFTQKFEKKDGEGNSNVTRYDAVANVSPAYGTISTADYPLWDQYKTVTDSYTGTTHWMQELEQIFIPGLESNVYTIDMAKHVYSYDSTDGIDSHYEKFVEIASQLELKDFEPKWLNAIVTALLTGDLASLQSDENIQLFNQLPDFSTTGGFASTAPQDDNNTKFYNASMYTEDSLAEFAYYLEQLEILEGVAKLTADGKELLVSLDMFKDAVEKYKGAYFTKTPQETANKDTLTIITKLNTTLVLKAADTTAIDNVIKAGETSGAQFAIDNPGLFVQDDEKQTYAAFKAAYDAAVAAKVDCVIKTNDFYYTKAEHESTTIAGLADALTSALNALVYKGDSQAPKIELSVSGSAISTFYNDTEHKDGDEKTNAEKLAEVDSTGANNPATGTLFMPNNGGYSLLVYTNEVSPRIVLDIEDVVQNLGGSTEIAPSKRETLRVSSQRTSGTTTNLIYGTKDGSGVISNIYNRNLKSNTGENTGPLAEYKNEAYADEAQTINQANSSIFAILAPEFATNKATAAAIYTITVQDVIDRGANIAQTNDNISTSLVVGDAEVTDIAKNGTITVYIYYHNSMADNTDEGIVVTDDGMAALATPKYGASHVASVLLSGEPNYAGAWRRGLGLTRGFDSTVRSWEFMSQLGSDNSIGTVKQVAYDDPNFGDKNLGSFYYVLDKTTDADIYSTYASGKNSTVGLMDYDNATLAKTAMIDKINAMSEDALKAFKDSTNFNIYGGTDADGNYVNYAQVLTDKVEMGDLVFVHVVDRWGNVVNRIVEITNLDKVVPVVKATEGFSGQVTITETGGSGIKDITVHNGDFSLGDVDYKVDSNQNVTFDENVVDYVNVVTANNKLTLSKLVPGKTYYIGTVDNAGNSSSDGVKADASGQITLTVTNTTANVETDEDGSVASNSSTFTLNGTDMITINAGEASSVIDASLEGNVFANRAIRHYVTTKDTVTALKTVYQDGTVEEWTPEDVTVKDNGDGTLRWLIPRTLTPGEHSYKVYAKVDGEYETFYAPATITATNRTIRFTYTIAGMGRTVLKYSGSSEIKNSTMDSREIPYGAKVTITAEQTSTSSDFYYWLNSHNERIISTSNTYEFTAVTNTGLTAQFTSYESLYEGKKLVIYVNNAKNVIKAFELADGDSYTVPAGPVLPDYTFKGWSMTKDEVLASDKDTVIVEPVYTLSAENTVTITKGNYTATGDGTYAAEENQRAVVTISADAKDGDGNEFLYWLDADTNEIVSYDRTYSFFCVKDTVLTPVYGDASTITAEPIVRITEVKYNALSGKVSFFAERSVAEEFTILQTGIVVTKTESIGTNEEVFVVGGTSTAAGTSTSTANNGYYSASTAAATGQTVWARAYVIYETASGEILEVYGPVASYTVD